MAIKSELQTNIEYFASFARMQVEETMRRDEWHKDEFGESFLDSEDMRLLLQAQQNLATVKTNIQKRRMEELNHATDLR